MRRLIIFALLCEFGTTENLYPDSAIVKDVPTRRQAPINDIISLDLDSPSDIHIKIIKENNKENLNKFDEEPMNFLKKHERLRDQELRQLRKHNNHYSDDGLRRKVDEKVKFNNDDKSVYLKQANDGRYECVNKQNMNVKLEGGSSSRVSQNYGKKSHQACNPINSYSDLYEHEKSRNPINHSDSGSGKDLEPKVSSNQAFNPLKSNSDLYKQENLKNPVKNNDQGSEEDHTLKNEGIMLVAIDNDIPIHVLKNYKALIKQGLKPINIDSDVYSTFVDSNGKGIYGIRMNDDDQGSNVRVNHDQIGKVRDDSFSKIKDESKLLGTHEGSSNRDLKNMYTSSVERNNFAGRVQENQRKSKCGNGFNGISGSKNGDLNFDNIRNKNKNIPGDNIDGIVSKNMDELSSIGGSEENLNRGNFKDHTDYVNFEDHAINNSNFEDRSKDEYSSDGPIEQESPNKNVNGSTDYENSFDELISLGGIENHSNILVANNRNGFSGKGRQDANNYNKDSNGKGSNGNQINYDSQKSHFQDSQKDEFNDSNDGTYNSNNQKQQENHNRNYHDTPINVENVEGSLNHQRNRFDNDYHENQSKEQENHVNNDLSTNEKEAEDTSNNQGYKLGEKIDERFQNDQGMKLSDKNNGNYETAEQRSKFYAKNQEHHENDLNYQDSKNDSENPGDFELRNNKGSKFSRKSFENYEKDFNHQKDRLNTENQEKYNKDIRGSKIYEKNHEQQEDDLNYQESRKNSENPGDFENRNNKGSKFSEKSFENNEKDIDHLRDKLNTENQEKYNKDIRRSKIYDKNHEHQEDDLNYQESKKNSENPGDFENRNNKGSKFSEKSFENYGKDIDHQRDKLNTENQEKYNENIRGSKFYEKNHEQHEDDLNYQESEKNSENPGDFENRTNKGSKFSEKSFENNEKDFDHQRDKSNTENQEEYNKEIQGNHRFQNNNDITNTRVDNYLNNRGGSPFRRKKINNSDEFVNKNEEGSFNRHRILMDAIRNRFRGTTGSYSEEKTEKVLSEDEGNIEFSPTESSKPICQNEAPQAHCIKEEDRYFCKIGKSSYTIYTGSSSPVSLQVIEDYVRSMFMKYGEGDRCLDMSLEPGKHGPCLKSKMPVDSQGMSNYDQTLPKSPLAPKRGSLNIICTPIEPPPKGVNCRNGDEAPGEVVYECRWRTPNKIILEK